QVRAISDGYQSPREGRQAVHTDWGPAGVRAEAKERNGFRIHGRQGHNRVRHAFELYREANGQRCQVQESGDTVTWAWLFMFVSAAMAGDWPQFRGPSASGIGDGTRLPVRWDATKGTNIVWKTEIPGLAVSSPVIWGDRVFLTTAISG